jgi:hypothetical protein
MLFMIARGILLTLLAKNSIFQPILLKNENQKGNQYK